MSKLREHISYPKAISFTNSLIAIWQGRHNKHTLSSYSFKEAVEYCPDLLRYPIDMFPLLAGLSQTRDDTGVFCSISSDTATYHPVQIAQFALAHWNAYLVDGNNEHKNAFLAQASWLLAHQSRFANDRGGWLVPSRLPNHREPQYLLSALAQGNAISVLIRAYQLTGEDAFLQSASYAVRTFELDILDGGVNSPIGEDGLFFEEFAAYPAQHVLSGYILALFGLYDYVAVTQDSKIQSLIEHSLTAFHSLIDEFDAGYWTYTELLHKRLASQFQHALHILLIKTLTGYTNCEHCTKMTMRWTRYQYSIKNYLHYYVMKHTTACYDHTLKHLQRHLLFRVPDLSAHLSPASVCVPIPAFPFQGGMRGVLASVAETMENRWQMTYLTNYKGAAAEGLEIEVFGRRGITSPWRFPNLWFYCLTGGYKLFKLLSQGSGYSLILPQDGLWSAAFAALVGKLMGVRVVCMDHGNVTCLEDTAFRVDRKKIIENYSWLRQLLIRLQSFCYWPSLHLLALIATPWIDHFLIAGDEVEQIYRKRIGVRTSRITRYAYIVDTTRFTPYDKETRAKIRVGQGISPDAIIITLINRLAPEKGVSFALEGIALAQSELSQDRRKRLKVIIAGDGPLRSQVERDIQRYGLNEMCVLWGEASPSEVVSLLGISDIFLYSGTRGTNYSVAVLEAMAAGCAVVGSIPPLSNVKLFAEGRGITIASGNAHDIAVALTHLCNNPTLCHQMGKIAREYIATYHNATMLRRTLLRTSYFVPTLI